jgi:hypothetical protein
MKLKRRILGLLLSAFIFIIIHDFVIGWIDSDTQAELTTYEIQQISLCESSIVHENIHNSLMTTVDVIYAYNTLSYIKLSTYHNEVNLYSFFTQNRLYRPPIS